MKTEELYQQMYNTIETHLPNLSEPESKIVKALCRSAYLMGFDNGKQNSTLQVVGVDAVIHALNQTKEG